MLADTVIVLAVCVLFGWTLQRRGWPWNAGTAPRPRPAVRRADTPSRSQVEQSRTVPGSKCGWCPPGGSGHIAGARPRRRGGRRGGFRVGCFASELERPMGGRAHYLLRCCDRRPQPPALRQGRSERELRRKTERVLRPWHCSNAGRMRPGRGTRGGQCWISSSEPTARQDVSP